MYATTGRTMKTRQMDSFNLRCERIERAKQLAAQAGLTAAHEAWRRFHVADKDGSGTAVCHDRALIAAGSGIFWQESARQQGRLFLMGARRVNSVLRGRLNGNGRI